MARLYGQALILTLSLPRNVDGLAHYIDSKDQLDARRLLGSVGSKSSGNWSVAKWADVGDVILFYQSASSIRSAKRLAALVAAISEHDKRRYPDTYRRSRDFSDDALELLPSINGSIFALGRVTGPAENRKKRFTGHTRDRISASVGSVIAVKPQVRLDRFRDFITIRRAATITPLMAQQFERLRSMLFDGRQAPSWFDDFAVGTHDFQPSDPRPWREKVCGPDVRFRHEAMLSEHLAKPLLHEVCDHGEKVFEEVVCYRQEKPTGRVDFWITLDGQPLPVEAKLAALGEDALEDQLAQYFAVTAIKPRGLSTPISLKRETAHCLVIDQHGLGMHIRERCGGVVPVITRGDLATADAGQLRGIISRAMS